MISADFLELAKLLGQRTDEASQRRAISTAYYAVFHKFAEVLTSGLFGFLRPEPNDAQLGDWLRVYRALDHAQLEKATRQLADDSQKNNVSYAEQLAKLSTCLSKLKSERHSADYDPIYVVTSPNISKSLLEDAETAFLLLNDYFVIDLLDEGLARKLALDALGIKVRK